MFISYPGIERQENRARIYCLTTYDVTFTFIWNPYWNSTWNARETERKRGREREGEREKIGRASCRERV